MSRGKARGEAQEAWTWMISSLSSLAVAAEEVVVMASNSTSSRVVVEADISSSRRKFQIFLKTQM